MICNKDNKLITCILFLDLSKAFDCVDHKILLEKLFYHGVKGTALKLLASHLDNRFQCTKIGDTKSSFSNVTCGVPQGSVVVPLLFLIYILTLWKPPTLILFYMQMASICLFRGKTTKSKKKQLTMSLKKSITGSVLTNYVSIIPKAISCSWTTMKISIFQCQLIITQYQNKAA